MLLPLIAKTNKIRQHKSKRKGKRDEEAEETEGRSAAQENGFFFLLIFASELSRPLHHKNTPMVSYCKSHQ